MTENKAPIAEEQAAEFQYELSPTLVLAYAWACGFAIFAAYAGFTATRTWIHPPVWPTVFAYLAIVLAVMLLRPFLIDVTADLGLREGLGLFLLHALIFATPKLIWSDRATLIDCLIALQIPVLGLLLRRENFVRLYLVNFLILCLSIFVQWESNQGGFEWAVGLCVFLAGSFAADRFFLELDRYPDVESRPFFLPLYLGLKYALVALAGGGALYAITPQLPVVEPPPPQEALDIGPGGARTISVESLLSLAWNMLILLTLMLLALVLIRYLRKRFQGADAGEDVKMSKSAQRVFERKGSPARKPPDEPRGFSPREQILRGYWAWCDDVQRFGLLRRVHETPKEFARAILGRNEAVAEQVGVLTRLFEYAKFSAREMTGEEADAFHENTRRAIDILLQAGQKKSEA
jgi:hypothetical protein